MGDITFASKAQKLRVRRILESDMRVGLGRLQYPYCRGANLVFCLCRLLSRLICNMVLI